MNTKPMEWWVNEYENGTEFIYKTPVMARHASESKPGHSPGLKACIHVREVLPGEIDELERLRAEVERLRKEDDCRITDLEAEIHRQRKLKNECASLMVDAEKERDLLRRLRDALKRENEKLAEVAGKTGRSPSSKVSAFEAYEKLEGLIRSAVRFSDFERGFDAALASCAAPSCIISEEDREHLEWLCNYSKSNGLSETANALRRLLDSTKPKAEGDLERLADGLNNLTRHTIKPKETP